MAWHKLEVRRNALTLCDRGYTARQAAELLGLSPNTVQAWKAKHVGVDFRGPGRAVPPEKWQELELLCFIQTPVLSQRQAAKRIGVSKTLGRQMWQAIRAYRIAGLRHPKLGEEKADHEDAA